MNKNLFNIYYLFSYLNIVTNIYIYETIIYFKNFIYVLLKISNYICNHIL